MSPEAARGSSEGLQIETGQQWPVLALGAN